VKTTDLVAALRAAWERPFSTPFDPRYLLHLAAEELMPTITVRYRLPEEQGDYEAARLGRQAISALWEIDQHCRSLIKHGEPSEETRELAEEIRRLIPPDCLEA
jgi:hypothetical protein